MEVGTDVDGRSITYDEATQEFSVGGIVTNIERLSAYDRGGQVNWISDEVRDWALEFKRTYQEYVTQQHVAQAEFAARRVAEQNEVARRARLAAHGYSPDAVVKFAGSIKGFATTILVLSVFVGVVDGLAFGALLARQVPIILLVSPVVFGLGGYLVGYLITMFMKVAADLMLAVVQIEMNTRQPATGDRVA